MTPPEAQGVAGGGCGVAEALRRVTDDLLGDLEGLRFGPPVAFVYNPLVYARPAWDAYVERFGAGPKEVVLLGMNPGPFGMAQTGVPFGEVAAVRDWMGIRAPIGRPPREHPKRPVLGFDCPRSEVSGRRLWGWAGERFGSPERFFSRFFVLNYCPLVFMEASGRNLVPERLRAAERGPLFEACDRALRRSLEVLQPRFAIGVGRFAERRLRDVVGEDGPVVGSILHPSPASPAANRGWAEQAEARLRELGVELPGGLG